MYVFERLVDLNASPTWKHSSKDIDQQKVLKYYYTLSYLWVFLIRFISTYNNFSSKNFWNWFTSLEFKYNKFTYHYIMPSLHHAITTSCHHYIMPSLHHVIWTIKRSEWKPFRNNSFFQCKGIQSVLHKALVSAQLFPAEELTETSVKAWKRHF